MHDFSEKADKRNIIYLIWSNIFSCWFCLLRRREPAKEKDGLGLIVPDEEEEGVVRCEVFLPQTTERYHACRGCSSLCPLFVHLHKGLVSHCGQEESCFTVHARQVGLCRTEHVCHAQFGQRLVKLVVFLQLEFGQVNKDI